MRHHDQGLLGRACGPWLVSRLFRFGTGPWPTSGQGVALLGTAIFAPDLVLIHAKPDNDTLALVRLGSHSGRMPKPLGAAMISARMHRYCFPWRRRVGVTIAHAAGKIVVTEGVGLVTTSPKQPDLFRCLLGVLAELRRVADAHP
jgi:hypothetical protein